MDDVTAGRVIAALPPVGPSMAQRYADFDLSSLMYINEISGPPESVRRKTVEGGVQIGHDVVDFLLREFRVHPVVPAHNLFPEGGDVLDFRQRGNVKLGRV